MPRNYKLRDSHFDSHCSPVCCQTMENNGKQCHRSRSGVLFLNSIHNQTIRGSSGIQICSLLKFHPDALGSEITVTSERFKIESFIGKKKSWPLTGKSREFQMFSFWFAWNGHGTSSQRGHWFGFEIVIPIDSKPQFEHGSIRFGKL